MFNNEYNVRFKIPMYSDERLTNKAPFFCLCTKCAKSDLGNDVVCSKHEAFMRMTQELKIAAPVFACQNFVASEDLYNFLDAFYDEKSGYFLDNDVSRNGGNIIIDAEHSRKLQREWKAQLALWGSKKIGGV